MTFWNVRSVRSTLEIFRKKRLLQVRLPDHLEELNEASIRIAKAAYTSGNSRIDVPTVVASMEIIAKICENIKNLDDTKLISLAKLNDLENLIKQTSTSQERKQLQQELKELCPKISALIEEIRVSLDNTKAEVDDGFR